MDGTGSPNFIQAHYDLSAGGDNTAFGSYLPVGQSDRKVFVRWRMNMRGNPFFGELNEK
jgi:hypothetical protein